jgi:hypothetical protein
MDALAFAAFWLLYRGPPADPTRARSCRPVLQLPFMDEAPLLTLSNGSVIRHSENHRDKNVRNGGRMRAQMTNSEGRMTKKARMTNDEAE